MATRAPEYDYVIVGAGSAGCVLADRLTEDADVSVLLLEAGPPDSKPNLHVPIGYLSLNRTDVDWDYATAPEPNCLGRRLPLPRGKTLGGSSSTNAMIYIRGNPRDFDDWQIPGWCWDDLFPYFLLAEDNERGASEFHAIGGPLAVSDLRTKNPMMEAFVEAAVASGIPLTDDFNGASQVGAGFFQVTQRDGMRCSTADAYLRPALSRPNLSVVTNTQVLRIAWSGSQAVGVDTVSFGRELTFRAVREVILSAGAYNSAQLLQLSGVGPADHLSAVGVDVVLDHPEVGNNLSDHPAVEHAWGSSQPVSLLIAGNREAIDEFDANRTGPRTSSSAEAAVFVATGADSTLPDIQIHAVPVAILESGAEHGVWLAPTLLSPVARGTVRIVSDDPTQKPEVRCNYWEDDFDTDRMAAGIELTVQIARQEPLASYCTSDLVVPQCLDQEPIRAYIARRTMSMFHAAGTCSMGTVVDDNLRVKGLTNLRVVDASVLPIVPRGNPNAVVIAVAERAADVIRGRRPLPPHPTDLTAAAALTAPGHRIRRMT